MPDASPHPRRPAFSWMVLAAGMLVAAYLVSGIVLAWCYGDLVPVYGWDVERAGGRWVVTVVDPQGPAAGLLLPGDAFLAVNDDRHLGPSLWLHFVSTEPRYTLDVRRGEREERLALRMTPRADPGRVLREVVPHFAFALGVVTLGVLVGLRRPHDPIARLLSLAGLASGLATIASGLGAYANLVTPREWRVLVLGNLFYPLNYAVAFHFFSAFPGGLACGRACRTLRVALYAWAAAAWAVLWLLHGTLLVDPPRARALDAGQPWIGFVYGLDWPFILVALAGSIVAVVRNYRRVRGDEPHKARQIRWIVLGTALGLAGECVEAILWILARLTGRDDLLLGTVATAVERTEPWLGLLIPATFGYAILRHRLLDVRVALRRGLQYVLAREALRITLLLPLLLLTVSVLGNPSATVADVLLTHPGHLALAAAAALSLSFRAPLQRWIDRRFFRAAYESEQLLLALIDDLKACESLAEVSALACRRIEQSLHPRWIRLFYRDPQGRLSLGFSSDATAPALDLLQAPSFVRKLEASGAGRAVSQVELPGEDRALLDRLGARFAVPIGGGASPLDGLILLGDKKSEEPYTTADARLLSAVASQIGILYETLALRERVASDEKVRREVLARLEGRGLRPLKECAICGGCYESAAERCEKDGHSLELSLPVERTIDGKYRLERLLGKGGMGAVYEAADLRLGRVVAVKVVIGPLFGDSRALRRFEREARAVGRLESPHVVTVHDYGELAGGGAYLVMERLRGVSMRDELVRRGPWPPPVAADWFEQILAGVEVAHAQGIVHRDLKPENVFLAEEAGRRVAKVLDFGLAKLRLPDESESVRLTVPGTAVGTLLYMSPEQLTGQPLDARTDVYSLAVMAVEALTGRHPFEDLPPTAVAGGILHGSMRLPGDAPEVRALDGVLQRAMAKDPAARFGSVGDMRPLLLPALRNCPRLEGAAPLQGLSVPTVKMGPASVTETVPDEKG